MGYHGMGSSPTGARAMGGWPRHGPTQPPKAILALCPTPLNNYLYI